MKITLDFENGTQITLAPESVHLADQPTETVLAFKAGDTIVPFMSFKKPEPQTYKVSPTAAEPEPKAPQS